MRPGLHPVRGVVFDLWNTLAYSPANPGPMEMLAGFMGISARSDWRKVIERRIMTRPFLGIREALSALEADRALPPPTPSERDDLIRRWNTAVAASRLYDDALPLLDELGPRLRIGLLSNTQSFDLDFLRGSGLAARLDVMCLSCNEGRLKPDPAFFEAVAMRMGLPPAELVMAGDSVGDDIVGALHSGLRAIHVDRKGVADPVPGSDGRVTSLTGIASLLS
jgi:putative hydrolase of the HAD superfamily